MKVNAVIAALLLLPAAAMALNGCARVGQSSVDPSPVGHAELQLIGAWAGDRDGHGNGVLAMSVAEAASDGSAFDGTVTFAAHGVETIGAVHAEMTPNGHLVAEVGADASIEVHIVDRSTLDYCFMLYGTDPVHTCGRLVRGS